jgi:two-component system sensor histidine kinase MprB
MSLRTRFTTSSAAVVALVIAALSIALYVTVSHALLAQVDRSLRARPGTLAQQPGIGDFSAQLGDCRVLQLRGDVSLDRGGFLTLVDAAGHACTTPAAAAPDARDVGVARAAARAHHPGMQLATLTAHGRRFRVVSAQLHPGLAVLVARPLAETDGFLSQLRLILLGGAIMAIALAAELGAAVSRYVTGPVRRLTEVVERISRSRSLSQRVSVGGRVARTGARGDEVRRLGVRFNDMLESLEQARQAHEQLISDASHELRTPLTSIRANVEVLARSHALADEDRAELVGDIVRQFEELTSTVNNVIDLARSAQPLDAGARPVRLDELAGHAVERARLHSPNMQIELSARACRVVGSEPRLQTALNNLVDNACKHGAAGGKVEVEVTAEGEVSVRDHGAGFHEDDLPHVFDRYYRSGSSRAVAGSGLGLAIVQQVAETHGGSVLAANAAFGQGAVLVLRVPSVAQAETVNV